MAPSIMIEYDVAATMRDGVELFANIIRPAEGGLYPVVLARTPYGKDFALVANTLDAPRMARAGYIVVIQDVRGRFRSGGEWVPMRHEYDDGYDTVEWAARLPGSSGAVGMCGASYLGFTQWAAALAGPPSLRAIVPMNTWADADDGVNFRGGAFELGSGAAWQLGAIAADQLTRRHSASTPELGAAMIALVREADALRTRGYYELPSEAFPPLQRVGVGVEFGEYVALGHAPSYASPFADPVSYSRITVPALNIGGWYDVFLQGTIQNYLGVCAHGATAAAHASRLLIGPWTHGNDGSTVGEMDFGFAAMAAFMNLETDIGGLTQRWFDCWLKGAANGVDAEPPVRVFVMGEKRWRDLPAWPPQSTPTPFFLHAGGGLATESPTTEPADSYHYDPADPTPTRGGHLLIDPLFVPGAADQRPVEARADVLSYTGSVLEHDLTLLGRVTVTLWAASDAPDTDFVARLVDVHPDGFAQTLADGIVRARRVLPGPLMPGEPVQLTIDLWSVANVFLAGHRLRLDVASASFPRWDRNLNTLAEQPTLADARVARQSIFHDAEHPSHVLLPVVV